MRGSDSIAFVLPEAPVADAPLLVGPLDRVLYFRTLPEMDRLSAAHLAAIAAHAREDGVVDRQVRMVGRQATQRPQDLEPHHPIGFLDQMAHKEIGGLLGPEGSDGMWQLTTYRVRARGVAQRLPEPPQRRRGERDQRASHLVPQ